MVKKPLTRLVSEIGGVRIFGTQYNVLSASLPVEEGGSSLAFAVLKGFIVPYIGGV